MKRTILFFASLAVVLLTQAQTSREFIKQNISDNNECESVAITQNNGNAMIYGRNGWATQGCPFNFTDALRVLNEENHQIQDIHLTEQGRWIILFENNGMEWNNIYDALLLNMQQYNHQAEHITTGTCNDQGDWILVTTNRITASSDELLEWLGEGMDIYGALWTACITDDAAVAVFEHGFRFYGNVPADLIEALRACSHDVYTIKIAGNDWFFRCTDGYWKYSM